MSKASSKEPRRRRFGVSLRMLMLLILAFGCWLGGRVRRAETQRRAVAQVGKPGERIRYDHEYSGGRLIRNGAPVSDQDNRSGSDKFSINFADSQFRIDYRDPTSVNDRDHSQVVVS